MQMIQKKVKEVVVEWLWPYETQTTSNPAELIKNDAEDTKTDKPFQITPLTL